jgi:putative lipoprotein
MKTNKNTQPSLLSTSRQRFIINPANPLLKILLVAALILLFQSPSFAGRQQRNDSFFAPDKVAHFSVSLFISAGAGFVAKNHFGEPRKEAVIIGFTTSISIGGLKELMDISTPDGDPSWKDFAVDVLGSLVGAAIVAGATR